MELKHAVAAGLSPFRTYFRRTDSDAFRIFLFHDIRSNDLDSFAKFISWLSKTAYILSPTEAADIISNGSDRSSEGYPSCLLTFDDGFISNYRIAMDILAKTNIKAVFFVCPGIVNAPANEQPALIAKNIFQTEFSSGSLPQPARMMSWDQLRQLKSAGHAIGNHGMWHQRLSSLSPSECEIEIANGAKILRREMREKTPWYAYPYGNVESITSNAIAAARRYHKFCRSGIRGENLTDHARSGLLADQVDLNVPLGYWRFLMDGGFDFRYRTARERFFAMAQDSTEK